MVSDWHLQDIQWSVGFCDFTWDHQLSLFFWGWTSMDSALALPSVVFWLHSLFALFRWNPKLCCCSPPFGAHNTLQTGPLVCPTSDSSVTLVSSSQSLWFSCSCNIPGGMLWDGSGCHHVCAWECVRWMLLYLFQLLTQVLLWLLTG